MSLFILLPIMTLWLAGGALLAKTTIKNYEVQCMERWGPGGTHLRPTDRPQTHMDGADWSNALFRAAGVILFAPLVATVVLMKYPVMLAYKPVRAFFLPPVQAQHEEHVEEIKKVSKDLELSVTTFMQMVRDEPPADPNSLYQLRDVIQDQWTELMKITDPKNAFDMDLRDEIRQRIEWDSYKEITA